MLVDWIMARCEIDFNPALEENKENMVVTIPLPGTLRGDLDVKVVGDNLSITVENSKYFPNGTYIVDVDTDRYDRTKCSAVLKDGILSVLLPAVEGYEINVVVEGDI